jgi:hypothetical protein
VKGRFKEDCHNILLTINHRGRSTKLISTNKGYIDILLRSHTLRFVSKGSASPNYKNGVGVVPSLHALQSKKL